MLAYYTYRYGMILADLDDCSIGGNGTGNITGQDSVLGPLQYNGDANQTMVLLAGSPAVDQVNLPASVAILGTSINHRPAQWAKSLTRRSPPTCDGH